MGVLQSAQISCACPPSSSKKKRNLQLHGDADNLGNYLLAAAPRDEQVTRARPKAFCYIQRTIYCLTRSMSFMFFSSPEDFLSTKYNIS